MSNLVQLECRLVKPLNGPQLYEFKLWDNYGSIYGNLESKIEDDLELLNYVLAYDYDNDLLQEQTLDLMRSLHDHENGLLINNCFYDFSEIKSIISNI